MEKFLPPIATASSAIRSSFKEEFSANQTISDSKTSITEETSVNQSLSNRNSATRLSNSKIIMKAPRLRRASELLNQPKEILNAPDHSGLTPEQRLQYILGGNFDDLIPMFSREEYCKSCGTLCKHPELLDIFNTCLFCNSVLREPYFLRSQYNNKVQNEPFEILFAIFCSAITPLNSSIDVKDKCMQRISYYYKKDRLVFRCENNLIEYFQHDPAPNQPKQLRIRYRMKYLHSSIFGLIILETLANGHFSTPVMITAPEIRHLNIIKASYGHPKGRSKMGSMSQEVTEVIQGHVDLMGGSYLNLSSLLPLHISFGDPCPVRILYSFIL